MATDAAGARQVAIAASQLAAAGFLLFQILQRPTPLLARRAGYDEIEDSKSVPDSLPMSSPATESTADTTVLLIEDDPVFAEIVRAYLRHPSARGVRLEVAERLDTGVERLQAGGVDAVLLDLKLPDSKGYETFQRVQEVLPSVPVIVLTSTEDDRLARRAVGQGAQDYLLKVDLTPSLLARSIRYAVERARSEATVRTSEALYRMMAEEATDLISRHTPEGRYLYVSPACRSLLGYEPEELLGRDAYDFFHPGDLEAIRESHRTILEDNVIYTVTYRIRRKDSGYVWFETRSRALRNPGSSEVSELLAISRDVTERQRAAARLENSERRYRAIVEDQTELVCRFLPAGELTFVNQAFCRFFEEPSEELLGRDIFSLFPEQDRVEVATRLAELDRERPIRSREQLLRRPDENQDRRLQWADRALFDDCARVLEYQSMGRDVTERHQLAEQLRQSQKVEVVGQLVGGIAHDFNNILTALTGYSDLLGQRLRSEGAEPSPEISALQKIVRRAAALTGQLMAFTRRRTAQPVVLDLSLLVEEVDAMLRQLIGEHIELVLEVAPAPVRVKADPGQIEQVIVNLAVNARDAMTMGGQLTITTECIELSSARAKELDLDPGSWARLMVADTGRGMDEAIRERVFEPFFTTKAGGRGTGLGLTTVARIVEELGGRILVESTPGTGSSFEVLLPRTRERPAYAEASGIWPVGSEPRGSENVLLVEDDEPVRSVLRKILERRGYRVRPARNAEQALGILEGAGEGFDVLLTDVVMSGMSGPELAEQVWRDRPRIKVLFISGYAEDSASFDRIRGSGFPLLQKPFSAGRLLGKLREVLDGPA